MAVVDVDALVEGVLRLQGFAHLHVNVERSRDLLTAAAVKERLDRCQMFTRRDMSDLDGQERLAGGKTQAARVERKARVSDLEARDVLASNRDLGLARL